MGMSGCHRLCRMSCLMGEVETSTLISVSMGLSPSRKKPPNGCALYNLSTSFRAGGPAGVGPCSGLAPAGRGRGGGGRRRRGGGRGGGAPARDNQDTREPISFMRWALDREETSQGLLV